MVMTKYELLQLIRAIDRAAYVADNESQLDEEELQLINNHIDSLRQQADAMDD